MGKAFVGAVAALVAGVCASGALAATWPKGSDPSSNFAPKFPSSCQSSPGGSGCLKGGLHYLNSARAHLKQPSYRLPANFLKLPADKQVLILTNLDRAVYKLPAIAGVTRELDRDASAGVHADNDPQPGLAGFTNDPHFQYFGSNWAYGYPNILFAYGSWMYDDGYKSPNIGCNSPHARECWGHRHNILLELPKQSNITGPTALGAAAGQDHHGQRGYAMILGRGDEGYQPKYLFKWSHRKQWW